MTGTRLLVKVRGDGRAFTSAARRSFGASLPEIEPILRVPPAGAAAGRALGAGSGSTWLRLSLGEGEQNPWDAAHALLARGRGFAASARTGIEAIEPDFEQSWPWAPEVAGSAGLAAADRCRFQDQDDGGGKARGPGLAWNQQAGFGQFADARSRFGSGLETKLGQVVVAHLDTGYDGKHVTLPVNLDTSRQRNFVDADRPNDARDWTPPGMEAVRNRGHGTATLALLAGHRLDGTSPGWPGFDGPVGGAPYARVIPIRIANWVVRFSTSTMVQGLDHARLHGAQVLSLSMGGLTSAALADAVNLAYDAGVVMVSAAGNNFAGLPTPKSIVFPARYPGVLAACGVMADGRAYAGLHPGTMQGNYGPPSKMTTALGAFTPNVPWAVIDCGKVVGMDGAGTSASTPQIAAAAALWLAMHLEQVASYPEPWMRVEAARLALFSSAARATAVMSPAETLEKIGQGVLKADAALAVAPAAASDLARVPRAKASWGWLDLILGRDAGLAAGAGIDRAGMFKLELTQMAQRVAEVDGAIGDNDLPAERISAAARSRYLEAALDAGRPSQALKTELERQLGRSQAGTTRKRPAARQIRRRTKALPAPQRRLRVYSLDPSIAKSLESVAINETTLSIPWEENLGPGPVGEYLEVVDVDPASNRFYDPVDLNEPKLLAQDGWPPSEGDPQFHQQMVYAVAMKTIGRFEDALGRKALWATRRGAVASEDGAGRHESFEVPRLRIYPHALRTNNAYYSPEKVALLFGYFPAASRSGDATTPGSMVFSCLSSDIIAHEMSHALLDGLHRRLQEASNPDVPAFHEAFADIVALFQHFSIPELVRFQVAQARGRLSAARLLGGLAQQFGEGTQRGGPLRDYLGEEVRKLEYTNTMQVHARGSILVSAVFEAFLRIVERRTADLVRIATGGTGVLPEGALHPDLVDRLTRETCAVAGQVLRMCIRALDYCPAVDITFGEYLRAIITSDLDLVPDDPHHYRLAFMEAFRDRGLLPGGVRTVSEETLAWSTLEDPKPEWLPRLVGRLDFGWDRELSRSEVFRLSERNRWAMWQNLKAVLAADPDLCAEFGLLPGVPRYDAGGEVLAPVSAGETTFEVFDVRPACRVAPDGSFRTEVIATIHQRRPVRIDPADPSAGWFWFRGGTTLILDPRKGRAEVRYSIVKNSGSERRLERQRLTATGGLLSPLRALYFGNGSGEPFAMLHAEAGGDGHG